MGRTRGRNRGRWASLVALLAVVGLLGAACGKDKGSDSAGKTTTTAASSVLGPKKAATGQALTLGFVTDGKSETVDNTSEVPAAQAAAKYVNEHLGGIAGHPIELKVCDDHQSPAGATQCVNELVAAKVPAVLLNVSGQSATIVKGLDAAKIPTFWWIALDLTVGTTQSASIVTNGLAAAFAGPAKQAAAKGAKKAAEVVIDIPSISGPAKLLAPNLYKKAGIDLDILAVPADAADMTPQIQAALAKAPDTVHITGNDVFCVRALKALKTLGYTKQITMVPQCLTQALVDGVPGGLEGTQVLTVESRDPKDKEYQLYHGVMDTYAKGTDSNGSVTSGGYAAVLGFARATKGLTGEVTGDTLLAAIRAMETATMPLAAAVTFKCDGTAVAIAKPICSTATLVATLDAKGKPVKYETIDANGLF
jgi:branched-chain amino acid transport system substrate-binding protein